MWSRSQIKSGEIAVFRGEYFRGKWPDVGVQLSHQRLCSQLRKNKGSFFAWHGAISHKKVGQLLVPLHPHKFKGKKSGGADDFAYFFEKKTRCRWFFSMFEIINKLSYSNRGFIMCQKRRRGREEKNSYYVIPPPPSSLSCCRRWKSLLAWFGVPGRVRTRRRRQKKMIPEKKQVGSYWLRVFQKATRAILLAFQIKLHIDTLWNFWSSFAA